MVIALAILGISLLIILHELGHYAVARACRMRVMRFSVGFGPALWSRQKGDTTWQIAAIPVGGFVQIQGMGPEDGEQNDERSFRNRPLWQRGLVMLAGPVANWLFAAVCIALLATSVGFNQPDESVTTLGEIQENSPAERAGLQTGDTVRRIGGVAVSNWETLVTEIRKNPEKQIQIELERNGATMKVAVTPERSSTGEFGVLGVGPHTRLVKLEPGPGIAAGLTGAARLTADQVGFLWGFATGKRAGKVAGIPGIVKMVSHQAERGIGRLLESLALLSIGLFLFNLLPIPALDGGRLVFLGVEAMRGRPVNQLVEGWVHAVGLVLLLALMLFISVRDLL